VWSADTPFAPSQPDTQLPTTPTNLQGAPFSATRIDLSWTAATDNIGVTSYRVLRDGGPH
jgi:hypothetical protein